MVLGGCAHSTMRGSVAMKISPSEAHVCLGNNEAKVGDKVSVFTNDCPPLGGKDKPTMLCEKKRTGTGTVTKLLNEHYSVVKFDNDIKFSEGTFVELE
tara:strand:+ start:290 stop:583 length:294 start_codon:yes stop_codon:yes gene_type:complete